MRKLIAILVILLVVGAIGVAVLFEYSPPTQPEGEAIQDSGSPTLSPGEPTFEWMYRPFTEDEIPRSEIKLRARYASGHIEERIIDSIEGGCNTHPEPDVDVYPESEMIICYYAGLGHNYKIVESGNAYLVQRKVFEEASPDYSPPQEPFETIAQFAK